MGKRELGQLIMNLDPGIPLPIHIGTVIISKLPISNLPIYRLVSKSWNQIILDYASSPKLIIFALDDFVNPTLPWSNLKLCCLDINSLTSYASFHFPHQHVNHFSILNCCNGLLLMAISSNGNHFNGIFNPMTSEFFRLSFGEKFSILTPYGFGFSPNTKQYKLFKIPGLMFGSKPAFEMETFTFDQSGIHQWRSVRLPFSVTLLSHGAYLDGIVYWIGKEKENELVVYALDVETEVIKLGAVMEVGPHSERAVLKAMDGTLYAIVFMYKPCPAQVQLWRMQENRSWIRDFVVFGRYFSSSFNLVKASDDGGILFIAKNDLVCLDKFGNKSKIKTLTTHHTQHISYACAIQSLHFGFLSNILAGR